MGNKNYICEKHPSKFHDEGFVKCIVILVTLILFISGCWNTIKSIQCWLDAFAPTNPQGLRTITIPTSLSSSINASFKAGMVLMALSVLNALFIFRPLYLRSYREGESDARRNDTVVHNTVDVENEYNGLWLSLPFYPIETRCEAEYLLNALCQPPVVYIRMNESLRPSARTLAVETRLDIEHIDKMYQERPDNSYKKMAIVPVVFQKRGELINHLHVTDANGSRLPTIQTHLVAETILRILDALFKEYDDKGILLNAWNKYKEQYYKELSDTTKKMGFSQIVVSKLLNKIKQNAANERLIKSLDILVNILASCYVLCVRISIDKDSFNTPSVYTKQRLPLYIKQRDYVRKLNSHGKRRIGQWLINQINDHLNGITKSSGMFYYNLANASLTRSYHLRMLGPEDTFCARGDILEVPPATERYLSSGQLVTISSTYKQPCDHNFKCEPLLGQRHAHVLFGNAQNYQNATFIFHYIGRPQDLFFAAGFLAMVCLVGLFIGMLGASIEATNTDIPAIMLIALSAICPWLYDRERNDRSESSLLDFSALLTTIASITGLLLFVYSKLGQAPQPSAVIFSWRLLTTCVATDAVALLFLSLLHASLYKARRLGRIDRRYGIVKFLGWLADSFSDIDDKGLKENHRILWRLRCLAGLTSAEIYGVIHVDDAEGSKDQKGPFIASRDWPRGWLATPGSFWWEIERERQT